MQVRNLLIAAGATLAGLTAIVAAPTAASAQEYRYAPVYRTYEARPAYAYNGYETPRYEARGWQARRYWERRREEERRREYWRHRHHEAYGYGYGYRY